MANQITSYTDNSPNTEQILQGECEFKISIFNYKGVEFEIGKSFFTNLNIFESLFEDNIVNGDITIVDSAGFEERLPIIGQEKIKIIFYNKRIPENRFEASFLVYTMTEKMIRDRTQMYTLKFISEEFVINLKQRVSKSYKGLTSSEIVSKIYEEYIVKNLMNSEYQKPLFYDKLGDTDNSFYLHHFVFPRIRPFQAINMVAKKSTGAAVFSEDLGFKSSNFGSFVFYENQLGFWFKSIGDLLNPLKLKSNAEYNKSVEEIFEEKGQDSQVSSLEAKTNKNNINVEKESISSSMRVPMASYVIVPQNNLGYTLSGGDISVQSYRFISTFDIVSNIVGGMYGSKLLTYDPITQTIGDTVTEDSRMTVLNSFRGLSNDIKKLVINDHGQKEYEYNYLVDFYNFRHISENPNKLNYPLCGPYHYGLGSTDSNIKYKTTNFGHSQRNNINTLRGVLTGNTRKFASFDNQVERSILTSNAQKRMMKNIVVQIKVSGDQNRKIGEIVRLKLPSMIYTTGQVNDEHTFYQGNYLITKIRHKISSDSTYVTEMELVKDSLFTALASPEAYVNSILKNNTDDVPDTQNPYGSGKSPSGELIVGDNGMLGGGV